MYNPIIEIYIRQEIDNKVVWQYWYEYDMQHWTDFEHEVYEESREHPYQVYGAFENLEGLVDSTDTNPFALYMNGSKYVHVMSHKIEEYT